VAKKDYKHYEDVYQLAHEAGHKAALATVPAPMVVVGHGFREVVSEGPCGFAWINLRPATNGFCRWLKKTKGLDKAYGGGMDIWVGAYGQSIARKEAYAHEFAKVINAHIPGIAASGRSRLD